MNATSTLTFLANHLWQSTVFGAVAAALALVLRNNHARVRYWLWVTASIKFLVPFALFATFGSYAHWVRQVSVRPAPAVATIEQWNEPFTFTVPEAQADLSSKGRILSSSWANVWPALLTILWLSGCLIVATSSSHRWRHMAKLVRSAKPIAGGREAEVLRRLQQEPGLSNPIRIVTSESMIEPGLFGIIHPVLLLPVGIGERIDEPQLEAILAHELFHARHRDNLWTAVHMAVEATFWFYPLVWWLGSRLIDERERACDEEVLRRGCEPDVYAKAMVEICKSYLAAPVKCVSGITGSDLKKRIEAIMKNSVARKLAFGKKLLLATIGTTAICGPIVIGFLNAQQTRAQSTMTPIPKWDAVSVKPCTSNMAVSTPTAGRGGSGGGSNPRRLDLPCVTTMRLITMAYLDFAGGQVNQKAWQAPPPIAGGPDWINSEFYKISAETETNSNPEMMRGPMMQAILEDRFKLKVHRETREVPAFILTVAKSGLKINPIREGDCWVETSADRVVTGTGVYSLPPARGETHPIACGASKQPMMVGPNRTIDFYGLNLSDFSQRLRNIVGRPVIDKTDVEGLFNLHIEFAPDDTTPGYKTVTVNGVVYDANEQQPRPPDAPVGAADVQYRQRIEAQQVEHSKDPAAPSFFTALEQQLGLKLNSGRGPGEFFIIDHVEKPTPN